MELVFESLNTIDIGVNPNAVHTPDNNVWMFKVEDTNLKAFQIVNPIEPVGDVDWNNLAVGAFSRATRDEHLSLVRLKNIPRVGIFGVWHQDITMLENELVTPERHRLAIWNIANDISNYVDDCTLTFTNDSPVASASLTLSNPRTELVGEDWTTLIPGMKVEVYLMMGDSAEYKMGTFYVDRVNMTTNSNTVSVDARNISGKLLRDQTLDENYVYTKKAFYQNVVELLDNAHVENYRVQSTTDSAAWEFGITFSPTTSAMDALLEMVKNSLNWKVIETMDGEIIVGSKVTYPPLQINSRYTFNRGSDVFSRSVERDDNDVFSRICCHYDVGELDVDTGSVTTTHRYVYKDVWTTADWELQPNKTLYVELPKNTSDEVAEGLAQELAYLVATAGIIESFIGPIRPQLLPEDEAYVVSGSSNKIAGLITTVKHKMGKQGFSTEFTVDSGGRLGKKKLKDYIAKSSQSKSTGEAAPSIGMTSAKLAGLPVGGEPGQVLRKVNNVDFHATWLDVHEVPSGGETGQVLRKVSPMSYDTGWGNVPVFKRGSDTFTANESVLTFVDADCTETSLVTVVITASVLPQGVWTVYSADGEFTINSTAVETVDITFDYYIQRE